EPSPGERVKRACSPRTGRKSAGTRVASRVIPVPSDITVVVATTARLPLIQAASLFSGRVVRFTDNKLAAAFESVQLNHPRLVAIEAPFAQTPQGQAFIERVEKLAVRGSTIQLIVQTNGRWTTTPYSSETAAPAAAAAKPGADRKGVASATGIGAPAAKGAN